MIEQATYKNYLNMLSMYISISKDIPYITWIKAH